MSTVAFIGVGAMGSRMAMNLLTAGHKLRVFNRDKAKTKPLADKGAEVCASPAEAAKGAEFVCSIVSDDGPRGVVTPRRNRVTPIARKKRPITRMKWSIMVRARSRRSCG